MRKNRDEFAGINKTTGRGKVLVFTIAVLAVCITGIMCARKLKMDETYITLGQPQKQVVEQENG